MRGCAEHMVHNARILGKGIVTAAMKIVIFRLFKEFPCLVRVEALVEEENKGSQKVREKVGFTKGGFLRKYGYNKGEIRDVDL